MFNSQPAMQHIQDQYSCQVVNEKNTDSEGNIMTKFNNRVFNLGLAS